MKLPFSGHRYTAVKAVHQTMRCFYPSHLGINDPAGRPRDPSGENGAQIKAVRPRSDYRQVSRRGFPDLGSGQTPRPPLPPFIQSTDLFTQLRVLGTSPASCSRLNRTLIFILKLPRN